MQPHIWPALVTVAALTLYIWMIVEVGRARGRSGVKAPAMTGDDGLERWARIQANTLEWLPIFLAGLWLFAIWWNDLAAAAIGAVWVLGRLVYALAYAADPARRGPGFLIQALAAFALLFGAAGRMIWWLATGS